MSEFSELWVVWGPPEKDGKRYPEHCAGWPEGCHEHVNDAINEHGLAEAKNWIVREHSAAPAAPAQEPVAQVVRGYDETYPAPVLAWLPAHDKLRRGDYLYTAPAPAVAAQGDELAEATADLIKQIEDWAEKNGEADFYTGRARAALAGRRK